MTEAHQEKEEEKANKNEDITIVTGNVLNMNGDHESATGLMVVNLYCAHSVCRARQWCDSLLPRSFTTGHYSFCRWRMLLSLLDCCVNQEHVALMPELLT